MCQNRIQTAFFALLRAGLWDRPIDDLSSFPLSAGEWKTLYEKSKQQTVEAIVFDGLQQLDASFFPPRPLLLQWCVRVERIEQRNNWMNQILAEQNAVFTKHGLRAMLLKGQGLAHCYSQPRHRVCGDIDWCFRTKASYQAANEIVSSLGIEVKYVAGYSASYRWKGCEIEHHQRLFDLHNPFLKKYLRRLVLDKQVQNNTIEVFGTSLVVPAPILQILQVNAHILKHLLSFGVGMRQLCDAARLYAVYKAALDGDFLKNIYSKTNILKWVMLLHRLLVDYIGLPKADLPFSLPEGVKAHWMMEEIWKGGDFGFYNEQASGSRAKQRLWSNFKKYFPYAPMEAISFPLVHFYSGVTK